VRFGFPLNSEDLTPSALSPAAELWLRAMVYGTGLVLLAITGWRFGKPIKPAATVRRWSGEPITSDRLQTGLEAAAVVCLMLLLSPMTSKAHYVVLLLPSLFIARAVVRQPGSPLCWILVPLAVFGPLTTKGLIGKSAGILTLAWGLPTCYVLVCLAGIWLILPGARPNTLAGATAPDAMLPPTGLR